MALSKFLPKHITGILTVVLMTTCITFWFVVMLPFIVLRLLPVHRVQRWASGRCVAIATWWVGSNKRIYALMHGGQQATVNIRGQFKPHSSYLVISNHSAWADIVVLFDVLHGHSPFGRFFLKQQLIWVPIVGVVCWAMDFPFMKRHSRQAIAKNPALATQDLETTRRACAVYKESPATVINFLEGTRFTPAKQAKTKSPYKHLLSPKYGGLSAALNAMGEQFAGLVNVTIAYQPVQGNLTWSWLCGQQAGMHIEIEILDIPADMVAGDFGGDPAFKTAFKQWVNGLWADKDALLARLKQHQ
ncbi:MAG TPA: acetyltransferase [Limnobacter sp.]|uniref:acetyltransferase n=1 Tax=Limnobacter sp. TaxID=2003368 RepID=UPI002ED8D04C